MNHRVQIASLNQPVQRRGWLHRLNAFFARSELTRTLKGFKREFYTVGLFSLVVNLLMLTPTMYMLQVYDRILLSRNEVTLLALSLITLFLFVILASTEWMRSRLLVRAGVRLDLALSSRVFNAAFEAHLNRSGDDPAEVLADLTNIRQFLTGNGIFAFFDAPWTPIYLMVLWIIHPGLGMIGIFFAIILLGLALLSHQLSHAPSETAQESAKQATGYAQSKLRNAEIIAALGMLDDLRRRWLMRYRQNIRDWSESQDVAHRLFAISKFVRYSQQSLVLGGAAILVIRGDLTAGAMIAANVLVTRAIQPLDALVGAWKGFFAARLAFERLERLLEAHPERAAGMVHPAPRGQITLEQLVAKAPGREQPILHGLDVQFPAGEVIAIVGPSGSGKSTLAKCLMGVWPDFDGRVLLDGERLDSWERIELGPHIGYLPQEIELFEGSVAENIARFGEIDSEKVIEAAKRANFHDMILRFPKGYDTPMGVAGSAISGGQRQRIALARAMYGSPSLLVLDEPNANLDEAGEVALARAVRDLKAQGKTIFLVTHRKQILVLTDRILVLADGSIQRYGTTAEIINSLLPPPEQLPVAATPEAA
ncbi:MAG: type I secretion system permease/ATPase [Betaproteobacteria bacterium]|nr:type I secretion system permease/ATPase [Betaproteobacteria bacterium]